MEPLQKKQVAQRLQNEREIRICVSRMHQKRMEKRFADRLSGGKPSGNRQQQTLLFL